MNALYKKLAVAYAPENVQKHLAKIEALKQMEREARNEARFHESEINALVDGEKIVLPPFPPETPAGLTSTDMDRALSQTIH